MIWPVSKHGSSARSKLGVRTQGVILRGAHLFSESGREAALQQLKSPQVRTAIRQLYEVLDQTVHVQTGVVALLSLRCKPPYERRQAATPCIARSLRLRALKGCHAQSLRGGGACAGR